MKEFKKVNDLDHEKELAVYMVGDSYRVCEDHGELVPSNKTENYIDIKTPVSDIGIIKLKSIIARKNNRLKKPQDILVDKKCSCGNTFKSIPSDAKKNEIGYWWNCDCKSTFLYGFKTKLKV